MRETVLLVFSNLSASELWPDIGGGLWLEDPYKRGLLYQLVVTSVCSFTKYKYLADMTSKMAAIGTFFFAPSASLQSHQVFPMSTRLSVSHIWFLLNKLSSPYALRFKFCRFNSLRSPSENN